MIKLYQAIKKMKAIIFDENREINERFISTLAFEFHINPSVIEGYYHILTQIKKEKKDPELSMQGKRIWANSELEFMNRYVDDMNDVQSKSQTFKDLSDLIDRTSNAVGFMYYEQFRRQKPQAEVIEKKEETTLEKKSNMDLFIENMDALGIRTDELFQALANITDQLTEKKNNEKDKEIIVLKEELKKYKDKYEQMTKILFEKA